MGQRPLLLRPLRKHSDRRSNALIDEHHELPCPRCRGKLRSRRWSQHGIRDYRGTGTMRDLPFLKTQCLFFAVKSLPGFAPEVSSHHHTQRYVQRTRGDGDGGVQILRDSRHARLRAYLHRMGRKLQRRAIQRHFRNLVLKPHPDSRVGNHAGIHVHNQLRKDREQTQGRWCCRPTVQMPRIKKSKILREKALHKSTDVRREHYVPDSKERTQGPPDSFRVSRCSVLSTIRPRSS